MNYSELKQKAEEMEVDLNWAVNCRRRYIQHAINLVKDKMIYCNERIESLMKLLPGAKDIIRVMSLDLIEFWQKEKKELRRIFIFSRNAKNSNSGVTSEMIEQARQYPIDELLPHPVKGRMTNCFKHEDKHPSMGIKNNTVRCFVCNESFDTIAVVRETKGLNFAEAVRYLN